MWLGVSVRSEAALPPSEPEKQLYRTHLSSSPALLHQRWHQRGSPWKRKNIRDPPLNRPLIRCFKHPSPAPSPPAGSIPLPGSSTGTARIIFPLTKNYAAIQNRRDPIRLRSITFFFSNSFPCCFPDCPVFCPIRVKRRVLNATAFNQWWLIRGRGLWDWGSAGFCFSGVFGKAVFRHWTRVFALETVSVCS